MIDRNEIEQRAYISSFDGLRAIAILALIIYQMAAYRLPGGFLGIDIFLIISGYFMTNHLMKSLMTTGKVPLRTFLVSRLAQLMKPMLAMMFVVISYLLVFQRELLSNLRGTMVTSFLFVNNWWQIWQDSSQSTTVLTQSPFEHLWFLSLGVQYYLLWPIIFVLLSVLLKNHRILMRVMAVLTVASAVVMLLVYQLQPSMLRILLGTDTRAFSVMIGSMVALLFPIQKFQKDYQAQFKYEQYLRLIPIVLLFVFLLAMNEQSPWLYRGGMVLFDLLIALLMMISLHPSSASSLVFRLKPLTMIGRRSLSYYLWYLPVTVLYQAKVGDTSVNPGVHFMIELFLIMIIAEVWYQLFERKRTKTVKNHMRSLVPQKKMAALKPLVYTGMVVISVVGFFFATPRLSAQEAALQQVVKDNEVLAKNTQSSDKKILRTINNISGLTREETVFSSNSSITFIGDTSLLAMAQEIPMIYPNAVINAQRNLNVYEMNTVIQQLKQQQQIGDIVVLMVGVNGAFSKAQLDAVLKSLGMEKQYFLVTTTINRTWKMEVNQVMQQVSEQYSNVHLLDWNQEASNHTDWFYEGKAFVNTTGATQQSLFIAKNIYQALRGS